MWKIICMNKHIGDNWFGDGGGACCCNSITEVRIGSFSWRRNQGLRSSLIGHLERLT